MIPVLLPGPSGRRRGDVAHLEFLINASWVEFLKTLDDSKEFDRLVAGITGSQGRRSGRGREPVGGASPVSRAGGVRAGRREVLLRPRQPDRLARERPEARGPGVAGGAVPGGAGAVGQRQVVGRARGAAAPAEAGCHRGERELAGRVVRPGDDPLRNLAAELVARTCPKGALPDVGQALKLIARLAGRGAGARPLRPHGPERQAGRRAAAAGGRPVRGGLHLPAAGRPGAGTGSRRLRSAFFADLLHAAAPSGGQGGGRPDDAVGLPGRLRLVPAAQRPAHGAPRAGRADAGARAARGDRAARVPGRLRSWSRD